MHLQQAVSQFLAERHFDIFFCIVFEKETNWSQKAGKEDDLISHKKEQKTTTRAERKAITSRTIGSSFGQGTH